VMVKGFAQRMMNADAAGSGVGRSPRAGDL